MSTEGREQLDRAFEGLEEELPARFKPTLAWFRSPASRLVRIPLALVFIVGAFLSVLPVFGVWMLPLGLLIIAQDVPFLQLPVARSMLWVLGKWRRLKYRKMGESGPPPKESH
jgi:hypothetical protein